MGLLSWWKGNKSSPSSSSSTSKPAPVQKTEAPTTEVPGMNGAVEVPWRDVTIFEFGSTATSADKVTLAGFCPVSDELEPCRWEITPAVGSGAPQFRVVF